MGTWSGVRLAHSEEEIPRVLVFFPLNSSTQISSEEDGTR